MSAIFSEIYIRGASATVPEFDNGNLLDGWDRLENTLKGAKYSIEPGLVKQVSNGNQRVLTEKISFSADGILIDKTLFDRYRSTTNPGSSKNEVDVMFYDVNQPEMITVLRGISLNFKGVIESGDSYMVNLSSEVEKSLGSCVIISGAVSYGILSGVITDFVTGLPIPLEDDVSLELSATNETLYDVADADGIYLFRVPCDNNAPTTVTLTINHPEYTTVGPVNIIVYPNQETTQDFELTPQ